MPAKVTFTVDSDLIQIRSRLWVPWARIALKHEGMAKAARQQAQQHGADWELARRQNDAERQTQLGTDLALALEEETEAGLVGICAAAFGLEALSQELEELGSLPRRRWTNGTRKRNVPRTTGTSWRC